MSSSDEQALKTAPPMFVATPPSGQSSSSTSAGPRKRGRPTLMSPPSLLEKIRQIAGDGGLFRIHHKHGSLYARARRQFGSWREAVRAAGLDYSDALGAARRRSIETRRKLRRQRSRPI